MRCFKDNKGAVFDVPVEHMDRFEEIFEHEAQARQSDFQLQKATELPDLKEDGGA
jgi:hypothetical protein